MWDQRHNNQLDAIRRKLIVWSWARASSILLIGFICVAPVLRVESSLGDRCDFERYDNGCFHQSNLECDRERNICVCLQGTVGVKSVCLKQAKLHEKCEFSQQCDQNMGCYQLYPILDGHFKECNVGSSFCMCSSPDLYKSDPDLNSKPVHDNRHNQDYSDPAGSLSAEDQSPQSAYATIRLGSYDQLISKVRPHHSSHTHPKLILQQQQQQQQQQQNLIVQNPKHYQNHPSQAHASTILSRIVWIFLILALISLMFLLLLIKYHSFFRANERTLRRNNDDRVSISSEHDVPPPYEVAIRMKV